MSTSQTLKLTERQLASLRRCRARELRADLRLNHKLRRQAMRELAHYLKHSSNTSRSAAQDRVTLIRALDARIAEVASQLGRPA